MQKKVAPVLVQYINPQDVCLQYFIVYQFFPPGQVIKIITYLLEQDSLSAGLSKLKFVSVTSIEQLKNYCIQGGKLFVSLYPLIELKLHKLLCLSLQIHGVIRMENLRNQYVHSLKTFNLEQESKLQTNCVKYFFISYFKS